MSSSPSDTAPVKTLDSYVNDFMKFSDVFPMFNTTPTVAPSNQQPLPLDDKQARLVGKTLRHYSVIRVVYL